MPIAELTGVIRKRALSSSTSEEQIHELGQCREDVDHAES
jgi:hypothetical protein